MTRVIVLFTLMGGVAAPPDVEANTIQIENGRPGTSAWQLTSPATGREIEGYGSLTSVNRGGEIALFVSTGEPSYTIEIFRLGWYGGAGARRVLGPLQRPGRLQPTPPPDPFTGLVECQWIDPYVVSIPGGADSTDWPSGVYLARLTAGVSGKQSYILFVVRDDARPSDVLFQVSVTTYQAYNNWGGKSLYGFNSVNGAAQKVSFNRPYALGIAPASAAGLGAGEFLTNVQPADQSFAGGWEAPMLRWLEREGYDVTYATNLDTHTDGGQLFSHRAFLSVGHDEYWTWEMRQHLEAALGGGVSLGFFGANIGYWQVRLEPSASGEAHRTMAAYKGAALSQDPYALDGDHTNDHLITVRFQDPPVSRPEDALIGVRYRSSPVDADVVITNAGHWVFGGMGLSNGDRLAKLVGYEADYFAGAAPPGTVILAHSPYNGALASDMTIYGTASGAAVFATGTMQWSWGLDDYGVPDVRPSRLSPHAQQITRNVLARFLGTLSPTRPAKPAGLTALPGDRRVTLSWVPNLEANLAGYNLYRGLTSNVATVGPPLNGATLLTSTSFVDVGVTNGATYYYALVAVDDEGDASPASDIVTATPTGLLLGGAGCLDDAHVVGLPVRLTFASGAGGCLDTGFTTVMRDAGTSPAPSYVPDRISVAGGTLTVAAGPGDAIRGQNDTENALAVRVDATTGLEIRTTLLAPLGQVENYENAGIWFGLSEDDYVKFVAAHEDGFVAELALEERGAFGGPGRIALTPAGFGTATSTVTLILKLMPGAVAGSSGRAEAFLQIDDGSVQTVGVIESVPAAFFSTASYAGVIQTHAGNATPFDARYVAFSVVAQGSVIPDPPLAPAVCLDDAVVSNLPVTLSFSRSTPDCPAGGFTTVMANGPGGPTDHFVPTLLAVRDGALHVTTTVGDPIRFENAAQNALAVRVAATAALEIRTTLNGPLTVASNYQSAGLWFGLGEDDYVKLTAAANDGPVLELSLEERGTFGGPDRVVLMPAPAWGAVSKVTLVLRLTPPGGVDGSGLAEAFVRVDEGAEERAGVIRNVPAAFFSGASYAGIIHSHAGSPAPIVTVYEAFDVRPIAAPAPTDPPPSDPPPPDTTPPGQPAGLNAAAGDSRVSLSWTPNSDGDLAGYRVYRGTGVPVSTTGTPLSGTAILTAASFEDVSALNGSEYWYVVVAVDRAGHMSVASEPVRAVPRPFVPGFIEANGRVVMEAEHYDARTSRGGQAWDLTNEPAGYAGMGSMIAGPDTGAKVDKDYARKSPSLEFQVNFSTPGTYHVWIRGYATSDKNHSVHIGLDGEETKSGEKLEIKTYNRWFWTKGKKDRATITVPSAGVHTINVWMRTDGVRVDRLLLTTNASETPSDTGPAESPRPLSLSLPSGGR